MNPWLREFPQLADVTYLNSCASGALSVRVRQAVENWLHGWQTAPDWNRWVGEIEKARQAFARLIGANLDEVAVQASTSAGVAAVLSGLPADGERSEIISTALDFPVQPLLASRATRRGFRHLHLPWGTGALLPEDLDHHIHDETALVMLPAVASFNGFRLDIRDMTRRAHAKGAPVMVDAFQALGTYPIDVTAWDVDFLVSGVYKWLLGTAGIGFVYARRDWHEKLEPTALGWYGLHEPYDFDPLGAIASDARRLQYGGASVVGAHAAAAGLSIIQDVGPQAIERHNQALGDRLIDGALELGFDVLTPTRHTERGSIVTFRVPDLQPSLDALARQRIIVNERLDGIRVSPHFYNTTDDVDRLLAVLDDVNP